MITVPVSAFYIGLFGLFFLLLAYRVVQLRITQNVGLGTGGHEQLERDIRVHANAAEYVPLALILLLTLELNSAPIWGLHLLGTTLLIARVMHATGLRKQKGRSFGRFYGTALTWLVILLASVSQLALLLPIF